MKLYDMLHNETHDIRMTCEDRWIVASGGKLYIYERKKYAQTTKVLKITDNETQALRTLKLGY